ncbi:hypothetical protein [Rhodovulum marinum]|uniref:Uncharacterized protein n=1 Tax=Rhodovulum marinum TaxID=320662 RepID=A0A4R2PVM8_9RHOB|nr:hypothetical protein [Rhodovulum marinum]TCP40009.1 hypothetical protein EV662_109135 [Rhodovulum marinum]
MANRGCHKAAQAWFGAVRKGLTGTAAKIARRFCWPWPDYFFVEKLFLVRVSTAGLLRFCA